MKQELLNELRDAGFPHHWGPKCNHCGIETERPDVIPEPTLSEIIATCGDGFQELVRFNDGWMCGKSGKNGTTVPAYINRKHYTTPEEAVARTWFALNKKS